MVRTCLKKLHSPVTGYWTCGKPKGHTGRHHPYRGATKARIAAIRRLPKGIMGGYVGIREMVADPQCTISEETT